MAAVAILITSFLVPAIFLDVALAGSKPPSLLPGIVVFPQVYAFPLPLMLTQSTIWQIITLWKFVSAKFWALIMHDVEQSDITASLPDLSAAPKRQRAASGALTRKQQYAQAQQRRRDKLKNAGYVRFNHLIPGSTAEKFEKIKNLSQLGTYEEVLGLLVTAALEGRLPLNLNEGA